MKNNEQTKAESVTETLYIPLLAKAGESKKNHPIIYDAKALELANKLANGVDSAKFDGGNITDHGIIVRTEVLDMELKNRLNDCGCLTVVNLGAGLDTRISRFAGGNLIWYDVDLPQVIELRKKYFNEYRQIRFLSKSILDPTWADEIALQNSEHVVVIAEGLLMYFTEAEVKQIFSQIGQKFPGCHMYFDVVHSYFVGKGISSRFKWGVSRAEDIKKLNPNIILESSWSTGDLHKERQSLFLRMMNIFPSTRSRSQIIHVRFRNSKED